jgi:hypothetical protein
LPGLNQAVERFESLDVRQDDIEYKAAVRGQFHRSATAAEQHETETAFERPHLLPDGSAGDAGCFGRLGKRALRRRQAEAPQLRQLQFFMTLIAAHGYALPGDAVYVW